MKSRKIIITFLNYGWAVIKTILITWLIGGFFSIIILLTIMEKFPILSNVIVIVVFILSLIIVGYHEFQKIKEKTALQKKT